MPFVPSFERFAREEGLREGLLWGLELSLETKFGAAGLAQLDELRQIEDIGQLRKAHQALRAANTIEEFGTLLRS